MRFKVPPYAHQLEAFERTRDLKAYALFWMMGLGKSRTTLDTAAWQYLEGRIDTLLVIAPKGVHRNWITDEVPAHLSPDVVRSHALWYEGSKTGSKNYQASLAQAVEFDGLLIVAMNYDAVITRQGKAFCEQLMKRRTMLVLDESPRIKNPRSKRTKAVIKLGQKAVSRRILTGTPITNGPFDAYSQIDFLDERFWYRQHLGSYFAFKNHFGIFQNMHLSNGRNFQTRVGFKNVDSLYDMLLPISDRKTKEEVLDLPPKVYSKIYVELTKQQQQIYNSIKDDALAFLESGEMVTAPIIIVQMLRLQQIINGFVMTELDQQIVDIEGGNPRVDALIGALDDTAPQQSIVWARFQHDIDLIARRLDEEKITYVRYDGRTSDKDRATAIADFRAGTARVFLANPAAAGEGLTLIEATVVIYYSNTFKLAERLQSEDRPHRIGQTKTVLYIDLVCPDTIDERIVKALRDKMDVASTITGDTFREWI